MRPDYPDYLPENWTALVRAAPEFRTAERETDLIWRTIREECTPGRSFVERMNEMERRIDRDPRWAAAIHAECTAFCAAAQRLLSEGKIREKGDAA